MSAIFRSVSISVIGSALLAGCASGPIGPTAERTASQQMTDQYQRENAAAQKQQDAQTAAIASRQAAVAATPPPVYRAPSPSPAPRR